MRAEGAGAFRPLDRAAQWGGLQARASLSFSRSSLAGDEAWRPMLITTMVTRLATVMGAGCGMNFVD